MKKSMPRTLKLYQGLQRKKKSHCAGRTTATEVKKAASAYVSAAVRGGQSKAEATRKANAVLSRACGIASKPPSAVSRSKSAAAVGKIKYRRKSTAKRTTARRRRA